MNKRYECQAKLLAQATLESKALQQECELKDEMHQLQ